MEVDQPVWRLRSPRCSCACGGEGSLCFFTCPSCKTIIFICDEVGTIFVNPKAPQTTTLTESDQCPVCSAGPLSGFRPSQSEEIQALGFLSHDYE